MRGRIESPNLFLSRRLHTATAPARKTFALTQRVYYQHTDAGGVVYHARYLDFMEAARTELLQSAGFDLAELTRRTHVLFIVYALQVAYHKPARLNDTLLVTAAIAKLGHARLDFDQRVLCGDQKLVSATIKLACIDARTYRPIIIPEDIRRALEAGAQ
jgi:tol-pal system-associated acyl-CoA thioesterase